MRLVDINKYKVPVTFGGFYYPIYSLVIVREKNKNVLGRIVAYHGQNKVVVKTKTGNLRKLKYSDVVFYEDPHKSEMTLTEFQRAANKVIDKYREDSVIIDDVEYIIDFKVKFAYDTEYVAESPTVLAAVCRIGYGTDHLFEVKVPYLQWASRAQINEIILHEVAHLLAPSGEDHGPIWRAIYMAMGGNGEATIEAADVTYANLQSTELPDDWRTLIHKVDIKYWEQLANMLQKTKTGIRLYADIVGTGPIFHGRGHYERVISKYITTRHLMNYKRFDVKEDFTYLWRLASYHLVYIDSIEREYDLDDDSEEANERLDNNTYTTLRQARQLRRAKKSLEKFVDLLDKHFIKLINT